MTAIEAQPSTLNPEAIKSDHDALNDMLTADKANGPITSEDNTIYKELIKENREKFAAIDSEGNASEVESIGYGPVPTGERKTVSPEDDGVKQAREAVMRQFGNVEDNWHNTNKS